MPVLTCGGMRFQQSWDDKPWERIPSSAQENLKACVHHAFDLGINHFETARGYGTSELQLGRILPRFPRDELIVQTKVSPAADPAEFVGKFKTSLDHLGLESVDLLALHGINNRTILDWSMREGGCLDAARRLQAAGRCRFLGFSTHGPPDVVLAAIRSDAFDYVNLHWYFVNDFNWPAIEEAAARDMGVFIISPNDKGGKLYEPPPKLVSLCAPLSPMAFNDLYCLARPQVHTLSIGATRPSDFDLHAAAVADLDRAAEVIAPVEARLRAEMDRVLGADWTHGWWQGIPEHDAIPGEVNVLEILRLWSLAKALDMVEFGKMRYNLLGQGDHWCPGCTAAAFDREALREAVRACPFADRIPAILGEAHEMLAGEEQKRLSPEFRAGF